MSYFCLISRYSVLFLFLHFSSYFSTFFPSYQGSTAIFSTNWTLKTGGVFSYFKYVFALSGSKCDFFISLFPSFFKPFFCVFPLCLSLIFYLFLYPTIQGFPGEISNVKCHPTRSLVAFTCSDPGSLQIWNYDMKLLMNLREFSVFKEKENVKNVSMKSFKGNKFGQTKGGGTDARYVHAVQLFLTLNAHGSCHAHCSYRVY